MSFFDVASEILAGLCSLGMLVGLVALALWLRRSRDQTQASFAAMARARGLSLTTPQVAEGPHLGGRLRVELQTDLEHNLQLDTHTARSVTALRYSFATPLGMGLEIRRRTPGLADLAVAIGMRTEIATGLPALDAAARIVAEDAAQAATLLRSPEVAPALIAALELGAYVTDDAIAWGASEWITDAARLDAATAPMTKLARALESASPRRTP